LAEAQAAVDKDPKNAQALAQLAQAHFSRKSYPDARKFADRALVIDPREQLANYVRAGLHLVVGENAEAYKRAADSLDEEHPQPNLLGLLAGLELARHKYDQAARWYQLGAKQFPGDAKWLKSLARVYLDSDNKAGLADVLARLAELDADDVTVRKKLTAMAHEAGDHRATIRWAREVIQVDVMDVDVHRQLAESLRDSGEIEPAIEEYLVATELDPDDAELPLALAKIYVQAGKKEEARTLVENLLKRDPDNADASQLRKELDP
jgi:tetratricopeptide (TPR) repeat protein